MVAAHSPAVLTIEGDLLAETIELAGPTRFVRTLKVPPGRHVIRFRSDGRPAEAPGDPRTLIWRAESFALSEPATVP
jgi:hypothetical protein